MDELLQKAKELGLEVFVDPSTQEILIGTGIYTIPELTEKDGVLYYNDNRELV